MTTSKLILILAWLMLLCSVGGVILWLFDLSAYVNPYGSFLFAIASLFFIKMGMKMVAEDKQRRK